MKINKNNITIVIGIVVFIISFLPFAPVGFIFLNFLVGFIGVIMTLVNKKLDSYVKIKLLILNVLIFFSFFIGMSLGYIFQ